MPPLKRQAPVWRLLPGGDPASIADAELARALMDGHPAAASLTWQRYASMVHGAVGRMLGNRSDADDLTQDVFITLFAKIKTLQDPTALRSFVYSIAVRVAKRELSKRWLRSTLMPWRDARDDVAPMADDAREAVRHLYDILDRLSARERSAYVLRHIEGLNLEETAAALSVSLATVKRILAKAAATVDPAIAADATLKDYRLEGGARETTA